MTKAHQISPKLIGAIIATGLLSFSGVIVETAMNITFPTLMKEFTVTTSTVQWMTTLYLLVVAAIVPLSATLKRRFKTKSLFLTANLLFLTGLVLDGLAPAFWVLLLGRAVQGCGTGIALPLMFNIILEQVPRAKIGMMMGVGTLITAVAPAIGPTFGGIVVSNMSWRFVFAFLVPFLLLSLVLGLTCIEQKTPTQAVQVDGRSIMAIVVAFVGLIFGVSSLSSQPGWLWGGALLVGLLALALFVHRSLGLTHPIINMRVFANTKFSGHVLAFAMFQISALGLSFLLPNYVQLVNGQTALAAGLVVLPGAALGAIFAPFSGRILDRFGARLPIITGAVCGLLGLVLFAIFGRSLSDGMIVGFYLCFSAGIGLAYGNMMTNGLKQLPGGLQADGNAVFNTLQQFCAAIGTAVAAALVTAGQTGHARAAGTALGSWHAFILLAVLLVVAFGVMWHFARDSETSQQD